jgi:hypothetical protein
MLRVALPVLAAGLVCAPAAFAQCSLLTLASGVPQSSSASPANVRFSPAAGTFFALGARSAAGTNHQLAAYATGVAAPTCMTDLLAASTNPSGVEVVVGDYRSGHNPIGGRFAQAVRTGGGGDVTFEAEMTARLLVAGEPPETTYAAPAVLDLFQTFLEAGNSYTLNLSAAGPDLRVLVFANPGPGTFWEGRGGPNMLAAGSGPTLFTASASTDYALVVVNEDGAPGTYEFWVELCQAPDTLAAGVSQPDLYPHRHLFAPKDPYWQAIGLRSDPGANWNLAVYDTGRGGPEPVCFGGLLAASTQGGGADVVAGDLSSGPLKPYYLRAVLGAGGGGARLEWDAGADEIFLGDPPVVRSTDAGDVLEVWDVLLVAGSTYTITFAPSGAADARWLLFANPGQGPGGAEWFGRHQAVAGGVTDGVYAATSSGWHGLVVVNENGGAGGYTVNVVSTPMVDATVPAQRTALGPIAPNPMRRRGTIGYTLARPGRVRVDLHDVAGRRVARLDGGLQPAGPGALSWDGRGPGGQRLEAGVYFARLQVDDTPAGSAARMVLLR